MEQTPEYILYEYDAYIKHLQDGVELTYLTK